MKLLRDGELQLECGPFAAVTGTRYDQIVLDAQDVQTLMFSLAGGRSRQSAIDMISDVWMTGFLPPKP